MFLLLTLYRYLPVLFSPFLANSSILLPLKTKENQKQYERFSGVFKGYKMGILATSGLRELILV